MACRFGLSSVTYAQAAMNALNSHGISARLVKLDVSIDARGCAYGIETEQKNKSKAILVFKQKNIKFKEIK